MISFLIPEENLPYNPNNLESVLSYAKKLEGRTLREATKGDMKSVKENKGGKGQLIEVLYFFMKNNNVAGPDFPSIEVELKTAGLKPISKNVKKKYPSIEWMAKEPLRLSAVNYNNIVKESFYESSFMNKNKNILLILHKYQKINPLDLEIKLTGLFSYENLSNIDRKIIRDDWELMKNKTLDGKAHKFSGGDFNYLELATSGTSSQYREQPFSEIKARTRKYSYKASFMHSVIANLSSNKIEKASLFSDKDNNLNLSQKIHEKFKPYIGMKDKDIAISLGISEQECKQRHSILSKNILKAIFGVPKSINVEEYIDEFSKADVTVKTVKLNENNMPDQNVSFPAFKYKEIYREQWDNSLIKEQIDCKFLFVFFKEIGNECFLDSISYWNMPIEDLEEVKKVWKKTKECVKTGKIVKEIKKIKNGVIRLNYFPKKTESRIAHIRPHGTNKQETYDLPVPDIVTEATSYTKQCIWLNNNYIRDDIYLKNIGKDI